MPSYSAGPCPGCCSSTFDCVIDCNGCSVTARFPTSVIVGVSSIEVNDDNGSAFDYCPECPDLNGDYETFPTNELCVSDTVIYSCDNTSTPSDVCATVLTPNCRINPTLTYVESIYWRTVFRVYLADGASANTCHPEISFDGLSLTHVPGTTGSLHNWDFLGGGSTPIIVTGDAISPTTCDGSYVIDFSAFLNSISPITITTPAYSNSKVCNFPATWPLTLSA